MNYSKELETIIQLLKEHSAFLRELAADSCIARLNIEGFFRQLGSTPPPPVLFQAKCSKCQESTTHISCFGGYSHLGSQASTTFAGGIRPQPLRTCCVCGEMTYREETKWIT